MSEICKVLLAKADDCSQSLISYTTEKILNTANFRIGRNAERHRVTYLFVKAHDMSDMHDIRLGEWASPISALY